jgi:hypothetical protein
VSDTRYSAEELRDHIDKGFDDPPNRETFHHSARTNEMLRQAAQDADALARLTAALADAERTLDTNTIELVREMKGHRRRADKAEAALADRDATIARLTEQLRLTTEEAILMRTSRAGELADRDAEIARLTAQWARECADGDRVLIGLGFSPETGRTEGGSLHLGRILAKCVTLEHIQQRVIEADATIARLREAVDAGQSLVRVRDFIEQTKKTNEWREKAEHGFRCFHCRFWFFIDDGTALEHFGKSSGDTPRCLLTPAKEADRE